MHKSTAQVLLLVVNCSLGSFFFGYSVAYINPSMDTVDVVFNIRNDIEKTHGMIQAAVPLGAGFGAFLATIILGLMNRREALIFTDLLGIIGCLVQLHPQIEILMLARFILGLTTGLNSAIVPLYVSEYSPAKIRGQMGLVISILIQMGLLFAFTMGLYYPLVPNVENGYWKFVFGFPILTCLIRILFLVFKYKLDSPKYYFSSNDQQQGVEAIQFLYKKEHVEDVQSLLQRECSKQSKEGDSFSELFTQKYSKGMKDSIFLSVLQQFSGINAVVFYSSDIFNGITNNNTQLTNRLNLMIPILGLASALFAGSLIERLGRKKLLQAGCIICSLTLAIMGTCSKLLEHSNGDQILQLTLLVSMFSFIFGFGLSLGPVVWLLIPELIPAKGACLATVINWFSATIVAQIFPIMVQQFSIGNCFMFFSSYCFLGFLYLTMIFKEKNEPLGQETVNYQSLGTEKPYDIQF